MRKRPVMHWLATILLVPPGHSLGIRDEAPLQHRQADAVVTGVDARDASGNIATRREIRDLKDNFPDQFHLYILGLESFQQEDQHDPFSFYGIAGIHGRPYKPWGNAPGISYKIGSAGYCPHSNPLFLGWHRPYLALFEQALYKHTQKVALTAPADQIERFSAAANALRIPYWDWGQGRKGGDVPEVFLSPNITIRGLDGVMRSIRNPLYAYKFHPVVQDDFDSKWVNINATIRWPTSNEPDAVTQNELFKRNFSGQRDNLYETVHRAFSATSYTDFARTVEEAHGWVHGIIGGWEHNLFGHFWPLEYSAFEPLFMLHHTNIDRLNAMYQAAHPDRNMVGEHVGKNGNVFLEDNQWVDADTPLLPFWKNADSFWTTTDVRNTTTLGYVYPETQFWKHKSEAAFQTSVTSNIARLYGGSTRDKLVIHIDTGGGRTLLAINGMFTDWAIEAQASQNDMPSTFLVRFAFLGDFSSEKAVDVGTWANLMPSDHGSLSRRIDGPSTPGAFSEKKWKGSISLTSRLIDQVNAGKIESLCAEDVVGYLRDKLTWKVYSGNGMLMTDTKLEGLTVQVISRSGHIPSDENLPVEYDSSTTVHPEATLGKLGGL